MKFLSFPMRSALFFAPAFALFAATDSAATTLQVISVGAKSSAQFMIDGVRREARVGVFTDEGLLLEKVSDDTVSFRYNGLPQRMRLGEMAVVDSQTQGLISHQIRADQKNKYQSYN